MEICCCESGEESPSRVDSVADKMLSQLHERASVRERSVPIPRRTLRFLAGNGRPALAATMLAQMIRCLWWNQGRCDGIGSCSSTFVADVFDVHERKVKRARRELRGMGWLRMVPAACSHVNAHGARAAINLAWSGAKAADRFLSPGGVISKSPPPPVPIVSQSPPPRHKHNLPSGSKNPKPACSQPLGVRQRTENPGKPASRCVVPDDRRSVVRLDSLFKQAVDSGLVRESSAERLRFFAAAEHAARVGTRNPCGLFVAIVRRWLWSYVSQGDEDRALEGIRPRRPAAASASLHRPLNRFGNASAQHGVGGVTRREDSLTDLVRELARLCSFDGVGRGARNRPACDDLTVAAA